MNTYITYSDVDKGGYLEQLAALYYEAARTADADYHDAKARGYALAAMWGRRYSEQAVL